MCLNAFFVTNLFSILYEPFLAKMVLISFITLININRNFQITENVHV
jgi:hypothetical protein